MFQAWFEDGRTVTGSLGRKTIKVKTRFGHAVIEVDKLGSINFGSPDVVLTIDQDEVRGTVEPKSFQLRGARARTTVRRNELVSIIRVVHGKVFGVQSFDGKWSTNYGPMELTQSGTTIRGTYGYGRNSIEGKLDGDSVELTYNGGEVTLELREQGALIIGSYTGSNGRGGLASTKSRFSACLALASALRACVRASIAAISLPTVVLFMMPVKASWLLGFFTFQRVWKARMVSGSTLKSPFSSGAPPIHSWSVMNFSKMWSTQAAGSAIVSAIPAPRTPVGSRPKSF